MDDKSRLQLQKMIKSNNVSDQTELIRNLKHSSILRSDIQNLILLKKKYAYDIDLLNVEAISECNFLWTHYTDLFNKIKKDEIDLKILNKFLDVLKQIEDGVLDQHEGSFKVGSLLKELYVDSALKKADKLNEQAEQTPEKIKPQKTINWKLYKMMR